MTSSLGTALGKVRIEYESTGVAKATKDVHNLQHSLTAAESEMGALAKTSAQAQKQINNFAAQSARVGKNIKNPAENLGSQVNREVEAATKALDKLEAKTKGRHIKISPQVTLTPKDVKIERGALEKAIEQWRKTVQETIVINSKIRVKPSEVEVDGGAFNAAVEQWKTSNKSLTLDSGLKIKLDFFFENQQIISLRNQIQSIFNNNPISLPANGSNGGNGGGGGAGAAGGAAAGLAARGGALALGAGAAAATAGIAGVAFVLQQGFSRLQGLDTAAAKLKALGYETAQITEISKNASKAVEGTAFSLDQAFDAAGNALASGIKPGQELTDYLKLVADNAALAGIPLQEMGELFNQVSIEGRLTGDVIDSLQVRGVDVFANLAKSMGVSQSAAREMATNGEIDFQKFRAAMNLNAGAAQTMGQTISGSFDNLMASVRRIGALLLKPIFGNANGEAGTVAKAIQFVTDKGKEFESWLSSNQGKIVGFWENAGKAALMFGQTVITTVGWTVEGIGRIVQGVGYLTGALASIVSILPGDTGKDLDEAAVATGEFGKQIFELGQGIFEFRGPMNDAWESLTRWGIEARNAQNATGGLGTAFGAATPPAVTLGEALEKFGLKDNQIIAGIQGTTEEFRKLLETLEDKGAPKELTDMLKRIRGEFEGGGRQVKNFASAMDKLKDSTASADDKAASLIDSLQKLGVLPADDVLADYDKRFRELTDSSREFANSLDTTGAALLNFDGTVNFSNSHENAQRLFADIKEFQDLAFTGATPGSGIDPGSAYDNAARGLSDVLRQYGIEGANAQKVIEQYLLPRDQFLTTMAGDAQAALESYYGNDPNKLASVIDLLTTQDDVLKQLIPQGTLQIPAEIAMLPDNKGWFGFADPNAPKPGEAPKTGAPLPKPPEPPKPEEKKEEPKPDDRNLFQKAWDAIFNPTGIGTGGQQIDLRGTLEASGFGSPDQVFAPDKVKQLLGENADLNEQLGPIVQAAEIQGENFADAFARGINENSEEVRQAILRLAELSAGLGNSPAPWGPLSGKGWTKERGKVFTKAYAQGIVSEANSAKAAVTQMVSGAAMPFASNLEGLVKDLSELSGLGQQFLAVGQQIAEMAMSTLSFANDLSGGRLFPKNYVKDPNAKGGSISGGPNLLRAPNTPALTTPGARTTGSVASKTGMQIPLIQNPDGTWTSSDPEWAKLIKRESGGNPTIIQGIKDVNSGGNEATGLFQIAKGTWESNGGLEFAPNAKDATPQQQAEIAARIFAAQGGSPWGSGPGNPYNRENEDLLRAGLVPAGQMPTPAVQSTARGNIPTGGSAAGSYGVANQQIDYGAAGFPPWVYEVAEAFGLEASTYVNHQTNGANGQIASGPVAPNPKGLNRGIDWRPKGIGWDTAEGAQRMENLAKYLQQTGLAEQVIFENAVTGAQFGFPFNSDYSGAYPGHQDHLHTRFSQGVNLSAPGQPVPVTLPDNVTQQITQTAQNTNGLLSMPTGLQDLANSNQLLRDDLSGPARDEADAIRRLQNYDSLIADANTRGDKALADQLGKQRTSLLSESGLKESGSALEDAQTLISGASGIATSVFGVIDSSLASIASAKNIGDQLVRGISNTEDVGKIIDNVQTFLELGQSVAQLTSDITGFASQMVGAGAAGDPSGGAQGAAMALGAVSTISGLVGQGFATANAVIDLGQEITKIAGKYIGRGITSMLGFPGATDMKFLLDTMTGQLQAYTSENPEMKHTFNTFGRNMNPNRYVDARRSAENTFHIYQGPGQDPRDTMTDAMFAVRSSGMGAFGYAV